MMKYSVGFTGTQVGMTDMQKVRFKRLLKVLRDTKGRNSIMFRHGDCVGADFDAHLIAMILDYEIVIHPPENPSKRAFCDLGRISKINKEKPYLERNRDIVDNSSMMIACPKEFEEQLRSGTWSTYRYALKNDKKTVIIWPDGSFSSESV